MNKGDFLTSTEVQVFLGLSAPTVRKMWRNGDFPQPLTLGYKKLRFRRSEVEEWLREKSGEQSAA